MNVLPSPRVGECATPPSSSSSSARTSAIGKYEELGEPFGSTPYKNWVIEHGKVSPSTGRRLPTYSCVYQRYRGQEPSPWKAACAAAGIGQ